ncbi:MAG: YCF48-related protein, partial [Acidobacteriota bacterium]
MNISKYRQIFLILFVCLLFAQPGAAEWKQQRSGTFAWLRSVFFVDANRGWIAGSQGTLLLTINGGQSWQKAKKFTDDNVWDVYFSDAKNGWLLCESDIYSARPPNSYLLQTRDGGNNWERVEFPGSRNRIVRFFFTKDGFGTAVGEGGTIWKMLDDKKTWKSKELPSRSLVLAGAFVDEFNGVLAGGAGK